MTTSATNTNVLLFKKAHAMAKATVQAGDNYQAVFGECLKRVIEMNKEQAKANAVKIKKAKFSFMASLHTIPEAIYQVVMSAIACFFIALIAYGLWQVALAATNGLVSFFSGFLTTTIIILAGRILWIAATNVANDYHRNRVIFNV